MSHLDPDDFRPISGNDFVQRVTKIITISKRSMFNENTLQLATSLDDRYFLYDYHELPSLVYPVMEQLCQSVAEHKNILKRKITD